VNLAEAKARITVHIRVRVTVLLIAVTLLRLLAAPFWLLAAWQYRVQTALDNERANHDRR